MGDIFGKLQLRTQTQIVVLDAPDSFEPELAALQGVDVARHMPAGTAVQFALVFVITQAQLDAAIQLLTPRAPGDAVLWFAYRKQSSRRYRCEFHRDAGWDALGAAGWESVRMVAIDEDWSALRWRRAAYMKKR